jgi:hypothetical protein
VDARDRTHSTEETGLCKSRLARSRLLRADVHARVQTDHGGGAAEWRTAISQARKHHHDDVVAYLQSLGARE